MKHETKPQNLLTVSQAPPRMNVSTNKARILTGLPAIRCLGLSHGSSYHHYGRGPVCVLREAVLCDWLRVPVAGAEQLQLLRLT